MDSLKNKIYRLLRKSEKYTNTDMVYLAKGGFWLTFNRIIGIIVAFVLAIVYANWLPKESYGTYKYILSIAAFFSIAALPGMNTSINRAAAIGKDGLFLEGVKSKVKWGVIGSLAGVALAAYYFFQDNYLLAFGFLVAALIAPISDSLAYGPYLEGKKLFKTSSIYSAVSQPLIAAALITTLFFTKNIAIFVLVYFFSNFLVKLILFFYTLKKYPPNKEKDLEMISLGKGLSAINLLSTGAEQLDKILMWHFLGAAELAIYSFSLLPANNVISFLKMIPIIAFPKLANQSPKEIKQNLPKKFLKFYLLIIVLIIIYLILAPYFYQIFFPEYLASLKYALVFSLSILFFPQRMIAQLLIVHASKKDLYLFQTLAPIIRISFLTILLPLYGIWGAIAALLFSNFSEAVLLYYFFKKL